MKSVRLKVINVIKQDIVFKPKQDFPSFTTLYWNDGEPSYEAVRWKGITKNWRNDKKNEVNNFNIIAGSNNIFCY